MGDIKGAMTLEHWQDVLPFIIGEWVCRLPMAYKYGRKKNWRVNCEVTSVATGEVAKDLDGMAWFPGNSGVFAGECLSAYLSTEGHMTPDCHPVGFIQMHRDALIWVYWHGKFTTIQWEDITCDGSIVRGVDDAGGAWEIRLMIEYAGWAKRWPDWLEDD